MSRQVDENVVKMTFDNRDFEKNIKNTTQSLDDFKRKLLFSNESKSFDAINKKAASTDLSPIGKAVESVSLKFSALQVVGVTALANITNSAVNAGKNIANSLTIQPITTGFNEYELKMNSIQTIMASTGESLSTVKKYLEELNTYSDKTIYSFSDMTSNIGKFTNAGVKLEDAVMAIKGISNEAAVSGANANEASRAMYNFSQALSAGYVKLTDWKSIELANMATLEFKNQLLEAGVAAGTLTKQADGMYKTIAKGTVLSGTKNFNETLDEQWMTTEVLVNTLRDYADETTAIGKKAYASAQDVKTLTQLFGTLKEAAQSGWSTTWELIVGDFDQSKNFFTSLSQVLGNIIGASADARNAFIGNVMNSGYDNLTLKIKDAGISVSDFESVLKTTAVKDFGYNIDELTKKYGSLSNAFSKGAIKDNVITRTLDKLIGNKAEIKDITKSVENFEKVVTRVIRGDFGNGKARIDALTKAGYDYKTVQDLVNKTLSGVKVNYDKLNETQLKNLGYTDEQIAKLKEIQNELEKTGGISGKMSGRELLTGGIQNIIEGFKNLSSIIKKAFSDVFDADKEGAAYNLLKIFYDLTDAFKNLSKRSSDIKDTFGGLFSAVNIVYTIFKKIYDFVKSKICSLLGVVNIDLLSITANIGRFLKYLDKFISTNLSLKNIGNFWLDFFSKGKSKVGSFVEEISKLDIISKLSSTFNSFSATAKETISSIGAFSGVGTSIKNLGGSLTPVNKVLTETATISKDSFKETKNLESGMISLTGTLNTVTKTGTSVLKTMPSTINSSLEKSSAGIMTFLTTVKNGIKNNLAEIATIAFTIYNLMTARKLIPVLDKVATGIVSVTAPLKGIGSVFTEFANNLKAKRYSTVMQEVAISIGILTASLFVLTKIGKDDAIWKALGALAALSVILVALSYALNKSTIPDDKKSIFSPDACKTMIGFSVGVIVLSKAMEKMSKINFVGILKGLFGIAVMMGIMVAAVKLLSTDTKKQISGVFSAISFAGALYVMAKALEKLAEFKFSTMTSGLLMIAGVMAAIILMSKLLTGSKDFMKAFAVLASSSILIFVALKLLEKIKSINTALIQRAIVSLLPIVAAMLVLAKILSGSTVAAGVASIGLAAIGLGISISLLMSTLSKIESIKPSVLASALAVVIGVGLILTAIVSVSGMSKHALKAAVLLLAASLAIATVAGVVVLLTHIKFEGLNKALITIGVIGGIFALLIKISGFCTQAHKTVLAIGAILTILLGVSALLTTFPLKNISGVTKLITSMAIAMGVLMGLSRIITLKSVGLVGLMGLVLSGLMACMALVINLVPEGAILKTAALEQALQSLAKVLAVCIVAGLLAAPAMVGAIAIIGVIAMFGGLMVAIGALSTKFDSIQKFLDNAIPIMASIGEALGSVIGGFINGIGSEASKCLPTIASNLSDFASNLDGFIELCAAIGNKDSTVIKGIEALTKVMKAFTAAEFMAAINQILGFGNGYELLSSKFTDISDLLASFNNTVSGMTGESVTKMNLAAQAAESLAIFASKIPRKGGAFDDILGVQDMTAFGDSIAAFGDSMVSFSSKVVDFNPKATSAVIDVGNSLSSLANSLPRYGGKIAEYLGYNDMTVFSNQLPQFGTDMVTFGSNISNFNSTTCDKVIGVASSLASFANSIPNSGGKIADFFGDNTMDTFGTQLAGFATSMVTFGNTLVDFNPNSLANVKVVTEILQLLCAKSDYDGGAVSAFNYTIVNTVAYKNDYATFGKMLKDLLKDMNDLNPDKALTNLNQLSTSLSSFFNSITPEKSASANSTVKMMSDVGKLLSSLKTADAKSIQKGASDIGTYYILGLKQGFTGVGTSIKPYIESLKSAINVAPDAYYIGVNTAKGFAKGVNDNISIAVDSVSALARKVVEKLKEVLDIHSPSKVTQQDGKFFGMGFIEGIKDIKKSVLDYVGGFGTNIKDKLSSTLETTSGKFNIKDMAKSMLDVNSLDIGSLTPSLNADAILNELQTTNEKFKGDEKLNQEELEKIQNDKLMAQNDFWSKLLTAKKKGIEADKYQDMSYLDFQKDTLDQVKSIWDEYISELESKSDSLNSRLGIFSEVAKKTEEQLEADSKVNGNSLIGNLKDQIQQYEEYYNIVKSLGMRIKDQDIMKQLNSQGLDSLTQLKAVNSMTDEQLDEFIALNKKKAEIAAETAYEQTSSLRQATENKLSWLLGGIDVKASDFAKTFDGTLESLQAYATQSIGKMQSVGKNLKAGVLQGMTADPQETDMACETVVGAVETGLRSAADIHSPSQRMADQVGTYLTGGIGYGMQDSAAMTAISDATKFVIDSLVSNFMSYKKTFGSIGEYIITSMFASKNVLQEAINAVNLCLTTPDSRPVIKPILDLSDVNRGFKGMSNMTSTVVARGISANIGERTSTPQNGQNYSSGNTVNYNFNQTNNSPKALNTAEIYQQTKKSIQLARIGG